jgi:protein tyrosine phosphatase
MEMPAANLVNKYIATQGPLPNTCAQFWQVVWDQKLSLVVMLTTLTERGRVSGFLSSYRAIGEHESQGWKGPPTDL